MRGTLRLCVCVGATGLIAQAPSTVKRRTSLPRHIKLIVRSAYARHRQACQFLGAFRNLRVA